MSPEIGGGLGRPKRHARDGDPRNGRNLVIARPGAVDWFDGFDGARMRIAAAPGQELLLRDSYSRIHALIAA